MYYSIICGLLLVMMSVQVICMQRNAQQLQQSMRKPGGNQNMITFEQYIKQTREEDKKKQKGGGFTVIERYLQDKTNTDDLKRNTFVQLVHNIQKPYSIAHEGTVGNFTKAVIEGSVLQFSHYNQLIETLDQLLEVMKEGYGAIDFNKVVPKVLVEIVCKEGDVKQNGQKFEHADVSYFTGMLEKYPDLYYVKSKEYCTHWFRSQQQQQSKL